MDIAAPDKANGPASEAHSPGSHHRHTHRSSDTEPSKRRTSSSKHHRHQHHRHNHHQLDGSERSSHHHKHRSSAGADSSQGRVTTAALSDNNFTPSTVTERRGSQAQESRKQSLHDAVPSSRASTTPSSRLPIRRHERLSLTEEPGESRRLSVAVASSATPPASSAASDVMRSRDALAGPNNIAAPSKSLSAAAAPLSPSSSYTFSGQSAVEKSGDAPAPEPSTKKARQHGTIHSSNGANKANGVASTSQPSTRQQALPLSEAVVAPPSPTAAALASLEAALIKPEAVVRSWQQDVGTDTDNIPSSLTSSAYHLGHCAARTVPPHPTPRQTSPHRSIAGSATCAPSSSATSVSQRAHVKDEAEALSRETSKLERTSKTLSQCGAGKARSKATEATVEGRLIPACHRSAAASLDGVPVARARQPPSVRSHTSSSVVEAARRSSASARSGKEEAPKVTGGTASSADQRLSLPDPYDKESRSSSRDSSGSYPPPPASASFSLQPAVAVASSLKAPQQQAIRRSFRATAAVSADNGDATAPNSVSGSATPRSCSGPHRRASSSRREYQVSVTSRLTTSVEPFHFNTERRSAVRRTASPCCAPLDPLAEVPAHERQRLANLPHHPSAAPGISRLDITFEEDAKELYRQTHLVDPLLRSRPGRRQFCIPKQADLFGRDVEPPMTVHKDGNKIVGRPSPIPIHAQSFLYSERQTLSRSQQQHFSMQSPSGGAGHDANDESAERPGWGLSSFVIGYGEESTAKGRSSHTPPRVRVVSDITAPYRRNMAANTGRTGYSQRESFTHHGVASPCGRETSPSPSAKSSSPGTASVADMSLFSTPFTVMQPKPSSQSTVPSQDQQEQCGDVMVMLSEDVECDYNAEPVAAITLSAPIFTVPAAVVIEFSSEGGAGSGCRHSQGISMPAQLTVVPPPTRVDASTAMELDVASAPTPAAATVPQHMDAQPQRSIGSTKAVERRSRQARNGERAMNATERALAASSATTIVSPPSEAANAKTRSNSSSRTQADSVAAAGPSESGKTPRDSRRASAASKPTPLLEQGKQLQPAASEPPAPLSDIAVSPTPEPSTHSNALCSVAPSTVVDSPPEPPITTASRHTDPSSVSMSSLSESSPVPQSEISEKTADLESPTPAKETPASVPAASAAVTLSSAPSADAPPPLPSPPLTKLEAQEGSAAALVQHRHEAAATAQCDTPPRSRSGSMRATVPSADSMSRAPSMPPSSSPSVAGGAAIGHRGSCSQALHVSEKGTQTEFVFVLDDLQGRHLLQRQQEQLLANLQLMQLRSQLRQQQQQPLLQILNAGSCSPSALSTSSRPQLSPSMQLHTSESAGGSVAQRQRATDISTGVSPPRLRRGFYVNNSSAVRDALRWTN